MNMISIDLAVNKRVNKKLNSIRTLLMNGCIDLVSALSHTEFKGTIRFYN